MLKIFRIVGFLEACSFLALLGIAMPLKYMWDMPLAVKYTGWAHGLFFMAYVAVAFALSDSMSWPRRKLFAALVAAVLPFGPFVFDRKVLRAE